MSELVAVDGGVFPCRCADRGDYCMLDREGGDPNVMWDEYFCVTRVRGVVYKRDESGKLPRCVGTKPSDSPIRRKEGF